MRGGVAGGHHQIAGADQRRQSIHVIERIDIRQALHIDTAAPAQFFTLRRGVAVLQIDEFHARQLQQGRQIIQPDAFQLAVVLGAAQPGQSDHQLAVTAIETLAQSIDPLFIDNQIRFSLCRKIMP